MKMKSVLAIVGILFLYVGILSTDIVSTIVLGITGAIVLGMVIGEG